MSTELAIKQPHDIEVSAQTIIHAPHKDNQKGDYFIDEGSPFVRSWETLLFDDIGRKA